MLNEKNVMEFTTWREMYALKNRNIYIIEKLHDEKTGKDKYLTFNEKTGKITQNQTYTNKNGEYIGLKGEKPFYLVDFKIKSEIEEEIVAAEEKITKVEIEEEIIPDEKEEKVKSEIDERINIDEISERQINILKLLSKEFFTKNSNISAILEISGETLIKELIELEKMELIEREPGKTKLSA